MIAKCKKCATEFKTYPSVLALGKGLYCSRKCSDGEKIESQCLICGKSIFTPQSRVADNRGKFCSRKCYVIDWNSRIPGWNKGKPATWMIGNTARKGMKNPQLSAIQKLKVGELNKKWKGDKVGYDGLHDWVKSVLGYPDTCEHCGKSNLINTTKIRQIDWANKSGKYLRDVSDWIRLCKKCHRTHDNQLRKIKKL